MTTDVIITARQALQSVLDAGRGTSGRIILEARHEQAVQEALTALPVERLPYAWEITQGPRIFFISASEFTRSSYDYGSFKPLYAE